VGRIVADPARASDATTIAMGPNPWPSATAAMRVPTRHTSIVGRSTILTMTPRNWMPRLALAHEFPP
jgi:hypothetical protein